MIPLYFKHETRVVHVTAFLSLPAVQFLLSSETNLLSASNDVDASITATARDLIQGHIQSMKVLEAIHNE